MKELHLIIKNPTDCNPLNHLGAKAIKWPDDMMSVGYKLLHENGEWYGEYALLNKDEDWKSIMQTALAMLHAAEETQTKLWEDEKL